MERLRVRVMISLSGAAPGLKLQCMGSREKSMRFLEASELRAQGKAPHCVTRGRVIPLPSAQGGIRVPEQSMG